MLVILLGLILFSCYFEFMSKFGKFNSGISGQMPVWEEDGKQFKSVSFNNLCYQVKEHRVENGGDLSLGWQNRLGNALCENFKLSQCSEFEGPDRKLSVSDMKTFFETMAKWSGIKFATVDQDEADRRAAICSTCPKNVEIHGCSGCFRLLSKIQSLIGNKRTKEDHMLQGCEVCACSLRAKVWLPIEAMAGTRQDDQFPDHCWLRSDSED